MMKIYTPFLFFFLMLIDAQMTQRFISYSENPTVWRANLLLIFILFSARYLSKTYLIWVALGIGVIFDLYYLGLIGIYAVILPLIVWIIFTLKKFLFENLLNLFFGMIIFITLFESMNVSLQLMFNLITVNPLYFITNLLGPTLLLNMILFFISFYPAKKLYWK